MPHGSTSQAKHCIQPSMPCAALVKNCPNMCTLQKAIMTDNANKNGNNATGTNATHQLIVVFHFLLVDELISATQHFCCSSSSECWCCHNTANAANAINTAWVDFFQGSLFVFKKVHPNLNSAFKTFQTWQGGLLSAGTLLFGLCSIIQYFYLFIPLLSIRFKR